MIKVLYYLRSFVLWVNYQLGNYKVTIWLIGDARSGTTWISSLLNYDDKLRELFEPFHPKFNKKASFLKTYEYVSPADRMDKLDALGQSIFSGNFYDIRADRSSKRFSYNGLLVKDIVVNLYAAYLAKRFPKVRILLLLRNPFAVALSKYELQEWNWESYEIEELFNDTALYKDHLHPFKDLINTFKDESDYIVRSVLFWCVFNYVPLKQLTNQELNVVFYEEILVNPTKGIPDLRQKLGLDTANTAHNASFKARIEGPSAVTKKKGDFKKNLSLWKTKITEHQYQKSLKILTAFGMEEFYDDQGMPNRSAIESFLSERS